MRIRVPMTVAEFDSRLLRASVHLVELAELANDTAPESEATRLRGKTMAVARSMGLWSRYTAGQSGDDLFTAVAKFRDEVSDSVATDSVLPGYKEGYELVLSYLDEVVVVDE